MDYKLSQLLNLDQQQINNTKIELNMTKGKYGEAFIDEWLELSENIKSSGENDNVSYWGWYGSKKNYYEGQIALSFVRIDYDKWLFISAGYIKEVPNNSRCKVQIIEEYKPLFGRLVIKYYKGNKMGRYVFKANSIIDKCVVSEILPQMYGGKEFPGYNKVINIKMQELKNYIENTSVGRDWKDKLKAVKAIYCLNNHLEHKVYIGSAYNNSNGLWGRWQEYLSISHGNNVDLKKLYNEKGEKYFLENFYFSILETFSLDASDEEILLREHDWMNVFNSRDKYSGYNNN